MDPRRIRKWMLDWTNGPDHKPAVTPRHATPAPTFVRPMCELQSSQRAHQRKISGISTEYHQLLPAPGDIYLDAVAAVSQPLVTNFDDLNEYYDLPSLPPPQRQQQQYPAPPLSQRRPPSSSSGSAPSLRRTPRLRQRLSADRNPVTAGSLGVSSIDKAAPARALAGVRKGKARESVVHFDKNGSTTPESFQRLVQEGSYWPERSTHLSPQTHDAILFALEAIRAGSGVDPKPLTADLVEERARMSDLLSGLPPVGSGGNGRTHNGTTGPLQGPNPAYASSRPSGVKTPTQIMKERENREARRRQQDEVSKQQEENVVGVVGGQASSRRPGESMPGRAQPAYGGGQHVTITGRRPEEISMGTSRITGTHGRMGEPGPSTTAQQAQHPSSVPPAGTTAPRNPAINPSAEPVPPFPQPGQASSQQGRSMFPLAFERWETLSSHWEGLTSYWIRRIQQNTEELNTKPIDQQMARQITDLSAAGANLFHAVVELQRLRASSERKFQRWFENTRKEQEQAHAREAELENQLRAERDQRGQFDTSSAAVQAERRKAEEVVREMRRELPMCKEEARRAWEELGRREQEERERMIALRNGETITIGGVQVVPMQGIPSRQTSTAQRPTTREGAYQGGAGRDMAGSVPGGQMPSRSQTTTTTLDSPEHEQQQFTFQAEATSPTGTDPFTESGRPLRHESDIQFQSTPQRPLQPPTSSAAMAAARIASSHQSPPRAHPQTSNGAARFYQQSTDTAVYNPVTTTASGQQVRPSTAGTNPSDGRSYIASTLGSEDEYEMNADGSYTLDSHGRRIPYGSGVGASQAQPQPPSDDDDEDDDEYDVASAAERERAYLQLYGGPPQRIPTNGPIAIPSTSAQHARLYAPALATQQVPSLGPSASPSRPQPQQLQVSQPDYSGAGYGPPTPQQPQPPTDYESVIPRSSHRHPTRLSDILEERSGMTSPSRASYVSAGQGQGQGQPDFPPSSTLPGGNGSHLAPHQYGGGNAAAAGGSAGARK